MGLRRIQDIVEYQLKHDEGTRNSDDYLYIKVLEYVKPNITQRPFAEVLQSDSIPSYESVGRARRKIQAEKPWLKACEAVQRYRADNEQKYREYALYERR